MAGPTYYDDDIAYLVRRAYLADMRLAKLRGATRELRWQLELGRDCAVQLRAYPTLRIEALDFYYACLLSLGALDDALMVDLLAYGGWRGVVWGAWVAILEPRPSFVAPLEAARPRVTHNRWIVDAALGVSRGVEPEPELREFVELAEAFRSVLALAQRLPVRLRRMPSPNEQQQIERERARVEFVYRTRGVDAARATLEGTLLAHYLMPYPQWVQATR